MTVRSWLCTSLATAVFLSAASAFRADAESLPSEGGLFERVTRSPLFPLGGRETGLLQIEPAASGSAHFHLEVTVNPSASDDGFLTRNGLIEDGLMTMVGTTASYRSDYPQDKELGSCTIDVSAAEQGLVVRQSGRCWWFGHQVDASGLYRRTANLLPQVVK